MKYVGIIYADHIKQIVQQIPECLKEKVVLHINRDGNYEMYIKEKK